MSKEIPMIQSPEQLRAVLLDTAIGVLLGKVSVPQANAVALLSCEIHKSIRQQWESFGYRDEDLKLSNIKRQVLDYEND